MSTEPTLTLSSSECPNCGASIDLSRITDDQTQVKCEYCGSMLNLPKREKLREIQAQTIVIQVNEPEAIKTSYTPPAQKSSGAGCALIIPILILGIIGVVFWQSGMFDMLGITTSKSGVPGIPNLPSIVTRARVFGSPAPLERVNDGSQEVAYLTLESKASKIINVDMTKQIEKWRSKDFSDRFTDLVMVSDAERVYVADQDKLVALSRENGDVVWESSLAYAISNDYQCRFNACLRMFGDRVVARLKDGTLQAVDGKTGKPAWSANLNYTSGGLYAALGNPAAIDTVDGKNGAATFMVFDINTGEVKQKIEPECMPERGSSLLRAEYPFASDDFQISPDGKALIVVGDGSTPCAWKFDLATGDETWRYTPDRNADMESKLPFMNQDPVLVSEEGVFVGGEGSNAVVDKLDMQTGEFSVLFTEKRYRTNPVLADASIVVLLASPNFDSTKKELWGIDSATGQKKWQVNLKVNHGFDDWQLRSSDGGFFLVQTLWEDSKVLMDVIDPQTGVSKGQQVIEMQNPDLNGFDFEGNTAWLNLSGKLHEVDMTSGKVKSTWP